MSSIIKRFAETVDEKLEEIRDDKIGETITAYVDAYSEFSDDLSEQEYLEFVKRNLKDLEKIILDSVEDQL